MKKKIELLIEILIGLLISAAIAAVFYIQQYQPSGNDIWGHIFKTEFLADQIRNYNFYPLFNSDWYGGIQLYRYWPILTYYITAFITLITNDVIIAYYVYFGVTFFIGYLGWCLIANRENKKLFVIIGILWWFLPDNTRVLFSEGNLARVFLTSLLPLFIYFFTSLIDEKKKFFQTVFMVILMTNTHFMITAMCAVIFCLYGTLRGAKKKTWYLGYIAFICGFIISAVTLLPGVAGGIVSDGNSSSVATMGDWSQDLFKSLFYLDRNRVSYAFGLFVFGAAVVVLAKNKGRRQGTLLALIFFILSDVMFIPVLMQMPLSQVWWMARFGPMCYVLILYEFGFTKPKRGIGMVLLSLLFVIDLIPTNSSLVRDDMKDFNYAAFEEAIEITDSRLGVLDESLYGSYPAYMTYKKVPYLQGWAIQGATIKTNIISATESLKYGWFGYTFKNTLELGCDTVLIKRSLLPAKSDEDLFMWAKEYGYELVDMSDDMYLFDNKDITGTYGTNFTYENIAIGNSAEYMCYMYPQFKKGDSTNIEDYTYDELSQYKKIYLSNFECKNFDDLEALLWKLSENGTEIYIDSTHIPINYMDIRELFNIQAKFLNSRGSFDLKYKDAHCILELPYEWNSTYLTTNDESVDLYTTDGIGYMAKKNNITILALNLPYANIENRSDELKDFFDVVFDVKSCTPEYEIVPVTYHFEQDYYITIKSDKPCVTNLAWQDNFKGNIEKYNNLVKINATKNHIDIYYKHLDIGLIAGIFGLIITGAAYIILIKEYEDEQ